MEFKHYLMRRSISGALVILSSMVLTFVVIKLIPGDPIAVMLGPERMTDRNLVETVTRYWGLDRPIHEQLIRYMTNFASGELGYSTFSRAPVAEDLRTRFPATIELTVFAIIISLAVSIPIGIVSATHRGSPLDHGSRIFSIAGVSAPSFWWGLFFLVIFYLLFGLVSGGRLSIQYRPPPFVTGFYTIDALMAGDFEVFSDAMKHIILPAFTLGLAGNALMMRLTRSSMLEVLNSDYVAMARMKGLRERAVIYKHALRNALIPTTTYAGLVLGGMLGGAVLIETVFSWNGMGSYIVNAIFSADFQAVVGVTFVMAVIYTIVNLGVDILYGFLDPRVRYG